MFRLTSVEWRRAGWLAPLALLMVLVLAGAAGPAVRAAVIANPALGGTAAAPAGRPAAGPPATVSVVNLSALPVTHSPPGQALPFHPVVHARGTAPAPAALVAQARLAMPRLGAILAPFSGSKLLLPTKTGNFDGITSEESGGSGGPCGCVPPDGDMATSASYVVVDVNEAFAVYSKAGQRLAGPVGFDTFFAGCGPSGMTSSDGIAAYDQVTGHFTVGILRYVTSNGPSYVSLAVSQTADPRGSWYRYCFLQPYQGGAALYDFPHISVGQQALFTTGNLFVGSTQSTLVAARVNAYDKQAMYRGVVTVSQVYSDVTTNSDGSTADTLRPALFNLGLPSATNYFVNTASDVPTSTRATLWRWTNPFSTNQFVRAGGVNLTPYQQPVPMAQLGGPPVPSEAIAIDSRTLGAMWANGTLYAAHAIGCPPGGTAGDCIQWWQVGNLNGAPTLIQQGIVGQNAEYRTYPNVAVDKYENVELSYSFSAPNAYIGIRHSGRYQNNPPGYMCCEEVIKTGEQAETGFNGLRWGDFSGSVLDPNGLDLWHFQEYSKAIIDPLGSWGTWGSVSTFVCQSVNFTHLGGVAATANGIQKISGAAGWNAGAVSTLAIASGSGETQARVYTTTVQAMFGLSHGDTDQSNTDIDYGIYTNPTDHQIHIQENGVERGAFGPFAIGDYLHVQVNAGVVKYYRNGALLYTSSVTAQYPLLMDTSIYTPSGDIASAYLCGRNLTPVP